MRNTKLFLGRSLIGWHKACNLNDYLVKAKITNKSAQCNGKHFQVCQYIEETCEFENTDGNKYDIRKGVVNCNTDFTVYIFHCGFCSKEFVGSNITDFCYQFNNYQSAFRKVSKSGNPPKVNQEYFHQYIKLPKHNVMDDWRVTLN